MSITKYASLEVAEILDVKGAPVRQRTASLDKIADYTDYRTSDGYLYARIRAISSRTNKNHDGWPSVELAGSKELFDRHQSSAGFTVEASDGNKEYGFSTFVGKPIFVDHHNSNPKKARGVIVDAKLKVLDQRTASSDNYWGSSDVDPEHMPPTEVELLLEVDAKSFPRLAKAIVSGDLDGFSMGCDVDKSICSHCGNEASSPDEYCSHILMKGAHHDYKTADGKRVSKKSYENCYGIKFFEISAVFDPADETALAREIRSSVNHEADVVPGPPPGIPGALPDPVRPHNLDGEQYALWLQEHHGIDPETALDLANRKMQQQHGTPPGHGEGDVYTPQMSDYAPSDMNGMPGEGGLQGFPPPRRTGPLPPGLDPEFADAADEVLNEKWPNRPIQNDPRWSATRTAENPLPQSMETRAPDEVDTLREEKVCPICGSDMDAETCDVCGFVEPPKEFDNPDLGKAQEIREKMKEQDESQATQPAAPGGEAGPSGGPNPGSPLGIKPGIPGGATKAPATASVTNEMRWTPRVHPKTAARINVNEQPVLTSNRPISDEPTKETVTSDQTKPVTSAMRTAQQLMTAAKRNTGGSMSTRTADGPTPPGASPDKRVDVEGVGGVDQASNQDASKADAQVDPTGRGGTGVEDVSADSTTSLPTADRESDDSGFNTDKNLGDGSGPTKTYEDSDGTERAYTDPVTNVAFPRSEDGVKSHRQAYDDRTLEQNEQQGNKPVAQGGKAVQGVQPVAEQFGKRVNVLETLTSPENNSGETKTWSGTDGNGVTKQQDPVTKEPTQFGGVKAHFMRAVRLAETEAELGLLEGDKWNRVAELDAMHPVEVQTQLETLARVKTAGLAKIATQRQSGVRSLPRAFGKQTAAPHGFERIAKDTVPEPAPLSDTQLDSALFTR